MHEHALNAEAVLPGLREGTLDPAAETVILNTGDGLKTLDAVAPVAKPTVTIRPTLESFRDAGLDSATISLRDQGAGR